VLPALNESARDDEERRVAELFLEAAKYRDDRRWGITESFYLKCERVLNANVS
jgi:hypothetical protein